MSSDTPKDGGPAFPVLNPVTQEQYSGMSLRQWYAGKALQGSLASGPIEPEGPNAVENSIEYRTRHCFLLADAMISEGEK